MGKIIIIGSGPAGISAALYTARAGMETTIFTMGHGMLKKAEWIENYYGFAHPIKGEELEENGIKGAKKLGVKFIQEEVVSIGYQTKLTVESVKNIYKADGVIIATGALRAIPRIAGIKEFEGKGISYCAVCDAFFYRGKDVCVLGSGEYALHESNALLPVASSVTLLTNGVKPTVKIPEKIEVIQNKITKITGNERIEEIIFEDGSKKKTDGVFIAYAVAGSTDLARKIGAEINGNKIVVNENMATNVPFLYAAGDCTGGLLQVAKAVYEGAKAGTELTKKIQENEKSHL